MTRVTDDPGLVSDTHEVQVRFCRRLWWEDEERRTVLSTRVKR